ncbi:hypothetical protein SAMN05428989_1211 [Pseudoxanthomonas sp. GM95]|uniref:DUF1993 domain-containing protein n=1 Tax=Pseudoxanthomonas sp. GM95 TaxID=1881043 RepID=UPI0008D2B59D|nr:DUF1993 domain-containing protein [Pseudoxanthomonas sp. GM95]SEK98883.1 hypothetical protein SAMN05428989_1211 [Pseudoxanthomonas sp. GM95]
MSLTLSQLAVPTLLNGLRRLSHVLEVGARHASEHGIDPATLIQARLAPDMLPLSAQIQRVSDTAKGTGERLSGVPSPKLADTETTFDELQARLAATIAYLESLTPEQVDSGAEREITLKFGKLGTRFNGVDYLLQFGLPNFHFHVVTAYDILRNQGVPVGKLDYLGPIGTPITE